MAAIVEADERGGLARPCATRRQEFPDPFNTAKTLKASWGTSKSSLLQRYFIIPRNFVEEFQ